MVAILPARWLAAIAAGKKLEELLVRGVPAKAAQATAKGSAKAAKPATRRSAMKGKKVAAKHKHPKTGDTWSVRVSKPRWLQAELKAGKKIVSVRRTPCRPEGATAGMIHSGGGSWIRDVRNGRVASGSGGVAV